MAELRVQPAADQANKGWRHLVKHCLDLYDRFDGSAYRKKKLSEIRDSVAAYEQDEKATANLWQGESKTTLPLTTISCDNLEPRLVAGLVGKKPYIYLEPEAGQKQDAQTEVLQEWYNQELEDHVHIESTAGALIHQLMQEGTVYILPHYDLDETTVRDFVHEQDFMQQLPPSPDIQQMAMQRLSQEGQQFQNGILMGPDGPVYEDKTETRFEGVKVDMVPFHDVYIADNVDDWEQSPVLRKIYPTYADIVNDDRPGYLKKNIGPWLCDEATNALDADDLSASQLMDFVREHGKKTIECIECYVTYMYRDDAVETEEDEKDAKDFTEERLLATIAKDSGIIIRLIPLRQINFKNEHLIKRIRLFPTKGKSYGSSIYAKMRAIQDGASKTFNLAINIAEVTLIPWFLYEERTGLHKVKDIQLKPGMGIKVDSVDGLYFPSFSVNPDQMLNWINLWVSFWERLLSIGDLQVGRQGEKDRTATETMAVLQEGNVKHNYQSQSIKDDFLSVLRTIWDLYYQHMPFDKTFLWNEERVPIPRFAMRRPHQFRLTGSTDQSNKLIERAEKEGFYQMTQADPHINPVKRAEELVKAYGHTDTEEWISPGIGQIVQAIMTIPGAMELVQQTLGEAQQMAQQMQQGQ